MLLGVFAAVLVVMACTGWHRYLSLARDRSPRLIRPTALGDHDYYPTEGEEDFHRPMMGFPSQPKGAFRRSETPERHDDSLMVKVGLEGGGRWSIYTFGEAPGGTPRYFLKAAEGSYIEFGARNRWPK